MKSPLHLVDRAVAGHRPRRWLALASGALVACFLTSAFLPARAVERSYEFDGPMPRSVLDSYLSRAVTFSEFLHGRGGFDDNLRFLTNTSAKFVGRAIYRWGGEAALSGLLERGRQFAERAHAADPDLLLQAACFEIVTREVGQLEIPKRVLRAFGQPEESRRFRYEDMLYPAGEWGRDHWGKGSSVPDISRLETRLWFYHLATAYLDIGVEALHFGQVEIMDNRDPDHAFWAELLDKVRAYARQHARRHWVVCDAHVPGGGIARDGRLLLDFHSFPLRIAEVLEEPGHGVLRMGHLDTIYGRSLGGITTAGWSCEHLPYLVELDNYGVSARPGESGTPYYTWGYDEMSWFAHQPAAYRNEWLGYAWDWLRQNDPNGWLQMPGSRVLHAPVQGRHWYWAQNASPATPDAFNQEDAIKAIWADHARSEVVSTGQAPVALLVSPDGDDANPGTRERPLATLDGARKAVRQFAGRRPVTVTLRAGTYYLPKTVVFEPEDSGAPGAPIRYQAETGAEVVLSGGMKLTPEWTPYRDGIWKAGLKSDADDAVIDQLFINGERQAMARYPNFDASVRPYNGFAADAFSPERAARWQDPAGGFIHAMHRAHWGGYHYRITGKDAAGKVTYEGGWQNNRQMGMHAEHRFVENIFEELDAPGEWFHDARSGTLYYLPPKGLDLAAARVEAVRLRHLLEFRGSQERPVRHLSFEGITFRHTARTFMDTREPLLRSDWTIYRGGAVVFDGAEDCALDDCAFDQVGGNTVFVNQYNRRVAIRRCVIRDSGGNGVAFVGDPDAVRNPLFEYGQRQSLADIERARGPKTDNHPADCVVEDCLITRIGRVEKQAAAVQISMARRITVRHCSIYELPRAGINISEGTWGGHLIEGCDVFDTVLETGDHGSFNSWGRDRYWGLKDVDLNTVTTNELKDLPLLDAVETTVLRDNRWRCDHGWDIDLDDGSSNYEIRNNLCLHGGLKLREGFHRLAENNIMVDNSFHPHVWYRNSQDVFRRNIVLGNYRPIRVPKPWGAECDFNLLHVSGVIEARPAAALAKESGYDAHSIESDALFVNPAAGDYRVRDGSPALALGFRNFPMDRFGVRPPALRALARQPRLPLVERVREPEAAANSAQWRGATLRDLGGGDFSALGVPRDAKGVLIVAAPPDSGAARLGLRANDLVQRMGETPVGSVEDFLAAFRRVPEGRQVRLQVVRDQRPVEIGGRGNP